MDSHEDGVQLPLSGTEVFLDKKESEATARTMTLIHNSGEDILGRHNNFDNSDVNINADKSFGSSLNDSLKEPRRSKRLRTDNEVEKPPEDNQKRTRIIELWFAWMRELRTASLLGRVPWPDQQDESFGCPFGNCDPVRYRGCEHNIATARAILNICYRRQTRELWTMFFTYYREYVKPSRLGSLYKTVKSDLYTDTEAKPKQHYMPNLYGLQRREVLGTINDIPVQAVPDYGSSIDAVSDGFARKHGMEVRAADRMTIKLPRGRAVESVGVVFGQFKFQDENQTYTRHFRVLKKCAFDMVLGREFLEQTKTLTDFCYRIVKRFRPCVQQGSRFFLLDESPKDRIRCAVNGANASAFPDTGSDLMLVSGDFARRNNLKVRRGKEYRQQVQLADGSFIRTDGMVLDAELEFDTPPMSSPREFDLGQYLEYDRGLTDLLKEGQGVKAANDKSVFICDLHVVDDLPCDIILSSDFILDHQVFSRFQHLFFAEPPPDHPDPHPSHCIPDPGGDKPRLDDYLLYIRSTKKARQWFRWGWRRPPTPPPPIPSDPNDSNAVPLQQRPTWEELWEAEEARRNRMQLRIASLPEPLKAEEQGAEAQRRKEWDRNHPRSSHPLRLVLPLAGEGIGFGVGMAVSRVGVVGQPPGGVGSV